MEHHGPTSWLQHLPLLPHDAHYIHVNAAVVVFLIIAAFAVLANRAIRRRQNALIVPSPKFSVATLADLLVESLHGMVTGVLGPAGLVHFSIIGALFVFVLLSNLMGLLPLSSSPSGSMNTTIALGLVSFVYYNIMGVKAHGPVGYAKHFLMGLGVVGVPIAMFELLSHVLRPGTLGLRLFLNMTIDHLLAGSFASLFAWLLPVPLLLFGIVVSTIQAFLFAVLTAVYIQMATEHEEHGDHHEAHHH